VANFSTTPEFCTIPLPASLPAQAKARYSRMKAGRRENYVAFLQWQDYHFLGIYSKVICNLFWFLLQFQKQVKKASRKRETPKAKQTDLLNLNTW
jgi:hypothetical protein